MKRPICVLGCILGITVGCSRPTPASPSDHSPGDTAAPRDVDSTVDIDSLDERVLVAELRRRHPRPASALAKSVGLPSPDGVAPSSLDQHALSGDDLPRSSSVADDLAVLPRPTGERPGLSSLLRLGDEDVFRALIKKQERIFRINQTDDRIDVPPPPGSTSTLPASARTAVRVSDAVVAIFDHAAVETAGQQFAVFTNQTLAGKMLNAEQPLCSTERFLSEPVGARCTGFLVSENVVVTASHCVNENNVKDTCFVFKYRAEDVRIGRNIFSASDVYCGGRILDWHPPGRGQRAEWAIVRLGVDKVRGHQPLKVRRTGAAVTHDPVFVVGCPCGLPLKYAGHAEVRDASDRDVFTTNLDAFSGNSGSPVFNALGDTVEGVLVAGETDFEPRGACWASTVCPDTGCGGEVVTRSTAFAAMLP